MNRYIFNVILAAAALSFSSIAHADVPRRDPPMPDQKPQILTVHNESGDTGYDAFRRAILIELASTDPKSRIPSHLLEELKSVEP